MPALSIGCTFSDRIEALLDGRVAIAGYAAAIDVVEPQKLFRQVLRDAVPDVAELSMASHIAAVAAGRRDYVGVPVFLSRSFRHSNLYIRKDRGIERPQDLAGRTVGLVDYQQTAALWLRGLLADDYGVARNTIRWVGAGLHAPMPEDRTPMMLPHNVHFTRSSSTLDALLAQGEIDAIISPGAPRCFLQGSAPVARLWNDPRTAETEYWGRCRVFPIMHVLVVRRSLVEADANLPAALYAAFEKARQLAADDLLARDFPKVMVPWLGDHARVVRRTLGDDPWTYGVEANRATLQTMLRYAAADGLTDGMLDPDELFA